jgi:hypothetical protein
MKKSQLVTTNILFIIVSVLLVVLPLIIGFVFSNVTEGMKKKKKKKNKKKKKKKKKKRNKKCKKIKCAKCPGPEPSFLMKQYDKLPSFLKFKNFPSIFA